MDNPVLNSIQELMQPIQGYEDIYEISNFGRVSNFRKMLKTYLINSGYVAIKLRKDGKPTSFLVHRLVAEHFVPNPDGKPEVNHIDGDKGNNRADNLEWVSRSENLSHARTSGLWVYNQPGKGVKKETTKSQYFNVRWDKSRQKWVGALSINNKPYGARRFESELEAAKHVNSLLDALGLTDRPRNPV